MSHTVGRQIKEPHARHNHDEGNRGINAEQISSSWTGRRGQDLQPPTWALQGSNNVSRPTNQMTKKNPSCHSVLESAQKHLWRASLFCKHTAPAVTAPFLRQESPDPGISGFYPASVPIGLPAIFFVGNAHALAVPVYAIHRTVQQNKPKNAATA